MFGFLNEFNEKKYISPGSLGGKIKRYREMRGLTQKQLGMLCGFSESTADVRIGQYENNKKVPRDKALKDLAMALEVDESALVDGDMVLSSNAFQALFDIEDFHGLHPEKRGDSYCLEFDVDSILKTKNDKKYYDSFLKTWYEMREKCLPQADDTPEQVNRKQVEYVLWKAEYPINIAKETSERLADLHRMNRLQEEIDEINARLKSDDELSKIDAELEKILPEVRKDYEHIQYSSELILIVKEMLAAKINAQNWCPFKTYDYDPRFCHIISIRTKEILEDMRKMKLYAKLECAFDTIRTYGVKVERCITSHKEELFVSFICPAAQADNFSKLSDCWDDMIKANNSYDMVVRNGKTENDLFVEKITGKNDIRFPAKDRQPLD